MLDKVNEAARSVLGPGLLPAHGPWVHIYILLEDQFGHDGSIRYALLPQQPFSHQPRGTTEL